MPKEIERKFLVIGDEWRDRTSSQQTIRQGYLCAERERSVRVRVAGDRAWITVKGATRGMTRAEFEYPIPYDDAVEMIETLCLPHVIEKFRYKIEVLGNSWEIDEFLGVNVGLIVAEVELESESQLLSLPAWIGEEVTSDPHYYNANLVGNPYSEWSSKSNRV